MPNVSKNHNLGKQSDLFLKLIFPFRILGFNIKAQIVLRGIAYKISLHSFKEHIKKGA